MRWIAITDEPIDPIALQRWIGDPAHGAQVSFYGVVRNHNQGREVLGVSYDVYEALALNVFNEICAAADDKWGPLRVALLHRRGRLGIGDISVAILVSSPHRDES